MKWKMMKLSAWFSVSLMIALVLAAGTALAIDKDQILEGIRKRYEGKESLTAYYTRTTNSPAMDGVFSTSASQTASGRLTFKKPAKMRLDQSSPREEKIITDGNTVWWYIPSENVVHRYSNVNLYGELQPLLDFLGGMDSLQGRYNIRVTPGGSQHRLDLTRTGGGSGPSNITVWFTAGDYTLAGFRLIALTGETTDFQLGSVSLGSGPGDGYFYFSIPAGAKVIDEQG
jgi:outer membrane lipoprotein carrier protein